MLSLIPLFAAFCWTRPSWTFLVVWWSLNGFDSDPYHVSIRIAFELGYEGLSAVLCPMSTGSKKREEREMESLRLGSSYKVGLLMSRCLSGDDGSLILTLPAVLLFFYLCLPIETLVYRLCNESLYVVVPFGWISFSSVSSG